MLPDTLMTPKSILPKHLHAPLRERGFTLETGACHRGDLSFAAEGRWYVLSEKPKPGEIAGPTPSDDQQGLWKAVQNGAAPHRIFEIPCWAITAEIQEEGIQDAGASFGKLLDWGLESREGRTAAGWQAPDPDLVKGWMARGALTVQADGLLRQGEMVLEPARWALRIPIVPQTIENLSERRRRALADLIFETQCRWAMVRFTGQPTPHVGAVTAEVDLTGAPHSELLFSAGLEAVQKAASRLAGIADVLANPSVRIQWLDEGNDNTTKQGNKTHDYA